MESQKIQVEIFRSYAFETSYHRRQYRCLAGYENLHHKTMHKKFKYGIPTIIIIQLLIII